MNKNLEALLIWLGLRRENTVENAISMFTEAMDKLVLVRDARKAEVDSLRAMQELLAVQEAEADEDMLRAQRMEFNMRKLLEE